jgi:dihydrofolate reductase
VKPTRRIVTFNHVSVDGYFSRPDGSLSWVVQDAELDRSVATTIEQSKRDEGNDTLLFGRRTYEQFEAFWPHALGDSPTSPDPHHAGRSSPEVRAMAVMLNEATKLVFSRSRQKVTWKNSRLLHEIDPREIEALKAQPGKDIMIFGSGSVVSQLTQDGLIDEYQFIVGPLVLGSGRQLITGVPQSLKLDLLEARAYPSGNVKLRYARSS